jgi:DNA-binding transcriptional regulator YdaS (Cro superfamily)
MKKKVAINYFGSSTKLANALGLHKSSISQWGEDVPELRAFQIELLTKGQLTVHPNKVIEPPLSQKIDVSSRC